MKKKKIITILGARPQFIKAAAFSRALRESESLAEIIIHTGQHYDHQMSEVFFNELEIPKPQINLHVGSGTHGKMTGEMLIKIEDVLLKEKPDMVMVYGDTNSTLAGALAASKLLIPLAHVEAGLRSFFKDMPEEQNRIVTDHLSELLFCPTEVAIQNLKNEGISANSDKNVQIYQTGDIMLDVSLFYREKLKNRESLIKGSYFLLTLHRAENNSNKERLSQIVTSLNSIQNIHGIFPVHPGTLKKMDEFGLSLNKNIKIVDPVGYLDMLKLESEASFIITDSGGVQKEAFFLQKPCVTLRDQTEWVETVDSGWNTLVGRNIADLPRIVSSLKPPAKWPRLYGSGNAAEIIRDKIINYLHDQN